MERARAGRRRYADRECGTTTTTAEDRRGVREEDEIAGGRRDRGSLGREDWIEGMNDGKVHEETTTDAYRRERDRTGGERTEREKLPVPIY